LFKADTIDGLTVEQYNILVELYNMKAEQSNAKPNKYTTSITSVEGKPGVNYGDD
jgi:hypothetical protein